MSEPIRGTTDEIDSVLMIGFGGPDRPDDVMPFLRQVVAGRGVPDERLAEVAHHYELVGGRSPYNEQTSAQAEALTIWLADQGAALPVYVGMRNWHPFLADTIAQMNDEGRRRAVGLILAAHRSPVSGDRYKQDVRAAIEKNAGIGPEVIYPPAWFDQPGFLEASAERIEQASGHRRGAWPAGVPVLFTAHSIPTALAERSPYLSDLDASCRGVASILGLGRWRLVYQSRSGPPATPWLEPDICDALREEAACGVKEVVVQAIGFLSDHVEVLFDLDVEAAGVARELGMTFRRAACVQTHPRFIEMLGRQVLSCR